MDCRPQTLDELVAEGFGSYAMEERTAILRALQDTASNQQFIQILEVVIIRHAAFQRLKTQFQTQFQAFSANESCYAAFAAALDKVPDPAAGGEQECCWGWNLNPFRQKNLVDGDGIRILPCQ